MVVTLNCRDLDPTALPCTTDDVEVGLTLEFSNDDSFVWSVDYDVFFNNFIVDGGSVVLDGPETRTISHGPMVFRGPANVFESVLGCGQVFDVSVEISQTNILGGLAPAETRLTTRSPAKALRARAPAIFRQNTCGSIFIAEQTPIPDDGTEPIPPEEMEANVSVVSCGVGDTQVRPDESVTVEAAVRNDNSFDVTADVLWRQDDQGVTVASREDVLLPAGTTQTLIELFVPRNVSFLPEEWSSDIIAEVGFGSVTAAATSSAPARASAPSAALRSTRLLADGGFSRKRGGCGCGCGGGC